MARHLSGASSAELLWQLGTEGVASRLHPPLPVLQGWCTLTDIGRFKHLMEKVGLLRRVLGPQILLRQHERAIRAMAQRGGSRQA